MLLTAGQSFGNLGSVGAIQGSPPKITKIDFPAQIRANGEKVQGYIGFEDPDGDIIKVRFEIVQGDAGSLQLKPGWEFDPQVIGKKDGIIFFQMSATAAQKTVRMRVTLSDRAGNQSIPKDHIFEVVQAPKTKPVLRVSPESLSFSGEVNRTIPSQTLTVTNVGGGSLRWNASTSTDAPWLNVSRSSGGPLGADQSDSITVSVNTANLPQGRREGQITISSAEAWNSPLTVLVSLNLSAPTPSQPPVLQVRPASLNFSGKVGDTSLPSQTIEISNTGGGVLSWVAGADVTWVRLTPMSGTAPTTVTVSVQPAGLAAGIHLGKVIINAPGAQNSPAIVTVTLTLEGPPVRPPRIGVSPGSLNFSIRQGQPDPASQTLTITNIGEGTLNWAATATISWLGLQPAQGQLETGRSATVTVAVRTAGLSVGEHRGQITISDPKADNSPVSVIVTLTIQPPALLQVSPSSLSFQAEAGRGNPDPQTLTLSSSSSPLTWSAASNSPWIRLSPTRGTTPASLIVSVEITNLTPDTYRGEIVLSADGAQNTPITVPVTLVIAPLRLPDLIVSIGRLPSQVRPGDAIQLDNTVTNQGTADADPSRLGFYLSPDRTFDRTDLLLETRAVSSLSPGAASKATTTLRLPLDLFNRPGFQPGTLFIIVIVDDQNQVAESDEQNNTAIGTLTVQKRMITPRVVGQVFTGGVRPTGIAATNEYVFVANGETNNLSVIEVATSRVKPDLIPVGSSPMAVAVSPNGAWVYVANYDSNDVSVIDGRTLKEVARIKVGKGPFGVAFSPNGQRAYVTNFDSNDISVIDTSSRQVIQTIKEIPSPSDIKVSPDGKRAYVASVEIVVVDLERGRVLREVEVDEFPWRLAFAPDGQFVYATIDPNGLGTPGKVQVISAQTNRVIANIDIGLDPLGLAVTPDGGFLLAVNYTSNNISVIDTQQQKVITTLSEMMFLFEPLEVAITPDGCKAFVTNKSNSVSIIELIR